MTPTSNTTLTAPKDADSGWYKAQAQLNVDLMAFRIEREARRRHQIDSTTFKTFAVK